MQEFLERISALSPKRLALLAVELQSRLDAAESARSEPIAIVGMACRFPGADSPEAYWQLLRDGVDAITAIPPSRWDNDAYYDPDPDAPGKIATRWGGFVEPIDGFEPQLFGISPREALSMDPQQRLLLEVSWEAIERAGYSPQRLSSAPTGVFLGICNSDYGQLLMAGDETQIDAYLSTGNAHSIASGRLSYTLGLQGPSISVDTACSSSLVAIHLAMQSLRNGECRAALAGGVNAILSPVTTITLSRARMMAADGRCKAFDAQADGFVRSEGCGMILLKRLRDALADDDTILATIRGSALNQDGRSNGITAPNGPSQVAVIRAALANAGLAAEDVQYVETHGTGTPLGDPIEVQALGAALGGGREGAGEDAPGRLLIGSVKTNIGHLESAAGVAGLMKLVLMMQHGEIPPHLHLREPSPHIAWGEYAIDIPTQRTPWPRRAGRLIGGVSSFGFSGTNAHLILESAPLPSPSALESESAQPHLLTLSARTESALRTLAARYAAHLADHPTVALADVVYTANTGRAPLAHRLALVAESLGEMQAGLAAFATRDSAGAAACAATTGAPANAGRRGVAFLFTGQGAHYPGMGRALYAAEPHFRSALDECARLLAPLLDRSLADILFGDESDALLGRMEYAQPALCALQVALCALWRAWGIEPDVVAGHSAGEYAAAIAAGVMRLEDGLALSATRGRLMARTAQGANGAMAAVFAPEAQVLAAIHQQNADLSIAAVNGPESIVISGPGSEVQIVVEALQHDGIQTRPLAVTVAAHSPLMDPILDGFEQAVRGVVLSPPQVDVIAGMTGLPATAADLTDPTYWRRQMREPVRFGQVVESLHDAGYTTFVEVGPHPTLIGIAQRTWTDEGAIWAPSLRREHAEQRQMLSSLGALFCSGAPVKWQALYAEQPRRRLLLPTYPFERQSYRLHPAPRRTAQAAGVHPLLGAQVTSPALQATVYEARLNAQQPAFLAHHRIHDVALLPSPVYLEMALVAAEQLFGGAACAVANLTIREALILPETGALAVQTVLVQEGDAARFQVFSRQPDAAAWTLHTEGRLEPAAPAAQAQPFARAEVETRCNERMDAANYYAQVAELGLEFGASFMGLTQIWRRDGEALGLVELPATLAADVAHYRFHPALLDSCFHLLGAPLPAGQDSSLLIGIDHFQIHKAPPARLWCHVLLRPGFGEGESFVGDLRAYAEDGSLVAEALGLQLRRATRAALLQAAHKQASDWFYKLEWEQAPLPGAETARALPAPHQLAQPLLGEYATLAQNPAFVNACAQFAPLDALSTAYALHALQRLGWAPHMGESVSADTLAISLGVIPSQHRLLARLLAIAAEEGLLRGGASDQPAEATTWTVAATALGDGEAGARAVAARAALRAHAAGVEAELTLIERCGESLADALRGDVDPLQLLFPNGSLALTEPLYRDAPAARVYNGLIATAVQRAVAHATAEGRSVRILEIGAGSGGTTSYVLPLLPATGVEYWFTDVSPLFTARAQQTFGAYPFVRYTLFDVEQEPAGQGLPAAGFDIVVAANVLHATANLHTTLAHVRRTLAPGGLLVLLEGTRPRRWVDITFGLTEGWWRFADRELRPNHPLLAGAAWRQALAAAGFDAVESVPGPDQEADQLILIARAAQAEPAAAAEPWLILANAGGASEAIADQLHALGVPFHLALAGTGFAQIGAQRWTLDAHAPDPLRPLLDALPPAQAARTVLNLWPLDLQTSDEASADAVLAATEDLCAGVVALAQAPADSNSKLWLITRNAQAVTPTAAPDVAQASLWGIGRVLSLEQPDVWGGLLDLESGSPPAQAAADILHAVSRPDEDDASALRAGVRYVPRLARTRLAPTPHAAAKPALRAQGAYLISGGLGGLGLLVADWLAQNGAGCIVLSGRHGLPPRSTWPTLAAGSRAATQVQAIQALEARGAQVIVAPADVADQAAMAALFARFGADLPPLAGIVHAAADLSNGTLRELPAAALHSQLRAKVAGGWLLHELSRNLALDFFVLFSSTTALWGARALGHYAAANQALDALAYHRRAHGLPALTINWGTWEAMRIASTAEQHEVASYGLNRMPAALALDALGALLAAGAPTQMVVAAVDWQRLRAAYEARRPRPLFSRLTAAAPGAPAAQTAATPTAAPAPATPQLLQRLAAAPADARSATVRECVREIVAQVLGAGKGQVGDDRQGLFEMGMDSLMAIELKGKLEAAIAQPLPSTLTFNYPNIEALTGFLLQKLQPPAPASNASPGAPLAHNGHTAAPTPAGAHDDLSEDELAARIAAKLARLR